LKVQRGDLTTTALWTVGHTKLTWLSRSMPDGDVEAHPQVNVMPSFSLLYKAAAPYPVVAVAERVAIPKHRGMDHGFPVKHMIPSHCLKLRVGASADVDTVQVFWQRALDHMEVVNVRFRASGLERARAEGLPDALVRVGKRIERHVDRGTAQQTVSVVSVLYGR
jgi:hypothetical protein